MCTLEKHDYNLHRNMFFFFLFFVSAYLFGTKKNKIIENENNCNCACSIAGMENYIFKQVDGWLKSQNEICRNEVP